MAAEGMTVGGSVAVTAEDILRAQKSAGKLTAMQAAQERLQIAALRDGGERTTDKRTGARVFTPTDKAPATKAETAKEEAKPTKEEAKPTKKVTPERKAAMRKANKAKARVKAAKTLKAIKRKAKADSEEEEEEEGAGGIKALEKAKARYAAHNKDKSPNHCGDWLALTLIDAFTTTEKEGKRTVKSFDVDGFLACAKANGLDTTAPWAKARQPGWKGRLRMNGRQKLESVIAHTGKLKIGSKSLTPPDSFVKAMQKRHGKEAA
jgi:hypothetical protein